MRLGRHEISITNPDKIFFPEVGVTKGELVGYYSGIAELVLPHLHRIEVERPVPHDDDLAVERRLGRQKLAERQQLREVAQERPTIT